MLSTWVSADPALGSRTLKPGDRALAQSHAFLASDGCQVANAGLETITITTMFRRVTQELYRTLDDPGRTRSREIVEA
jgi:hypothetical protein